MKFTNGPAAMLHSYAPGRCSGETNATVLFVLGVVSAQSQLQTCSLAEALPTAKKSGPEWLSIFLNRSTPAAWIKKGCYPSRDHKGLGNRFP
jgi:hypothetical protein